VNGYDFAKRLHAIPRIETMSGAERSCKAKDFSNLRDAPLEQIVISNDWRSRARYMAALSRDLAARTRAGLPELRSLIARSKSRVQEGRVRMARAEALYERRTDYPFGTLLPAAGAKTIPILCV
jgi:hypothetical protein